MITRKGIVRGHSVEGARRWIPGRSSARGIEEEKRTRRPAVTKEGTERDEAELTQISRCPRLIKEAPEIHRQPN